MCAKRGPHAAGAAAPPHGARTRLTGTANYPSRSALRSFNLTPPRGAREADPEPGGAASPAARAQSGRKHTNALPPETISPYITALIYMADGEEEAHEQEWHEPEEWELEMAREADAFGDG